VAERQTGRKACPLLKGLKDRYNTMGGFIPVIIFSYTQTGNGRSRASELAVFFPLSLNLETKSAALSIKGISWFR
jgi:hypothetical protein